MKKAEREKIKDILYEIVEAIEEGHINLRYIRRIIEEL